MSYDFSTAEKNTFDLVPAKTIAPIILHIQAGDPTTPEACFQITKNGLYQLVLECIVSEGEYAKRRFWQRLTMGARAGVELTEGQEKAVAISGSLIRALLESARGFSPTDDSPQAIAARKMDSLRELDGLEIPAVEIGIEPGKDGHADKNKIQKVLPVKAAGGAVAKAAVAAVASKAAPKAAWAT